MDLCRYVLLLLSLAVVGICSLLSCPYHLSGAEVHGATAPGLARGQEEATRFVLGVLEHYQSGEKKGSGVRLAFYKDNGQWKAFKTGFNTEKELSEAVRSFPETVAWTICFDGRAIGALASKNPQSYNFYADIGLHQVTSKGNVPTLGPPSTLFSGWPGGQSFRPLVLNSR